MSGPSRASCTHLSDSGSEGKPITLDGNTAGTFGEGRAILDGARTITDWKRCASAEEVQGNPKWREQEVGPGGPGRLLARGHPA